MTDIVKQIIKYYLEKEKAPSIADLKIEDKSLLEKSGETFVTIYKNGEICGNKGNVVKIKENLIQELIINTIGAIEDDRFNKINYIDLSIIKIRVDLISNRRILQNEKIEDINPIKNGVLAIKNTHDKLAVILPNISTTISSGNDLKNALSKKLGEDFSESDYILYEIETQVFRDF